MNGSLLKSLEKRMEGSKELTGELIPKRKDIETEDSPSNFKDTQ